MASRRYDIELEAEVRQWLDSLSPTDYLRVMRLADYLADNAETLGEPQTRHWAASSANCGFPSTAVSSASPIGLPRVAEHRDAHGVPQDPHA